MRREKKPNLLQMELILAILRSSCSTPLLYKELFSFLFFKKKICSYCLLQRYFLVLLVCHYQRCFEKQDGEGNYFDPVDFWTVSENG